MDISSILTYPAIFTQENDQSYSVVFPDLAGCFSHGNSFEDAFIKSQEALAIYYHENKGDIQKASNIFDIQKDVPHSMVQMVSIDLNTYILNQIDKKAVKKTLTIPRWLDELSKEYNVNYSNILKEGLINHLSKNVLLSSYDKILLNNQK